MPPRPVGTVSLAVPLALRQALEASSSNASRGDLTGGPSGRAVLAEQQGTVSEATGLSVRPDNVLWACQQHALSCPPPPCSL